MFANMDYPIGDDAFAALVELEVAEFAERMLPHPCLAVVCGGSEVEQRPMRQWVLKITDYADRLLEALDVARDLFDGLMQERRYLFLLGCSTYNISLSKTTFISSLICC